MTPKHVEARDQLIYDLNTFGYHNSLKCSGTNDRISLCPECIADFILADRKRIVEPLINYKFKINAYRQDAWNTTTDVAKAIDKTIQLANLQQKEGE